METRPLSIGITCFPTFGGSGVIATEIGMAMARRGHQVHFIAYDVPLRLDRFMENVYYHQVEGGEYPLFSGPYYPLTLASKMVEVALSRKIDLFHVHYAIPHATSALLAKQILKEKAPKLITTLHGTDITLVGNQRSYLPITRYSIEQSDRVTVPSRYLQDATIKLLRVAPSTRIDIIPNFVDTDKFVPAERCERKKLPKSLGLCNKTEKLITHVSNFRPVKRVHDVVRVFAEVVKTADCQLALIGDGPERASVEELARELGVYDRICFLGKQESFVEILQYSDVFLLPSETESFGLAALEALSCGVPVVATNVGGLPEVVRDGENGFLCPPGDIQAMSTRIAQLFAQPTLHAQMSRTARQIAVESFSAEKLNDRYENEYYQVLSQS